MSDDKRPYLYTNFETPYGCVELTVEGAEGETASELSDLFDEKLDKVVRKQNELAGENDSKTGVE